MNIDIIKDFLKNYDGPDMNIMEVCGSHTDAIAKYGIPSLLSPKLHLLSGPGCPVCVTTSSYIDKLISLSKQKNTCVVTFGDLIRVPGSRTSLSEEKGNGARVEMVYSPMDVLALAENEPDTMFVFAAVGFETTAPVYAMLMDAILSEAEEYSQAEETADTVKYQNIQLLTSIKTMPEVIRHLMAGGAPIHGFLAPGHVSVVTGSEAFRDIAKEYRIPFGVSGFGAKELLVALYGIVKHFGQEFVGNYYPSVVTAEGNADAKKMIHKYFKVSNAVWRGMGNIENSGLILQDQYKKYDAGSGGLEYDEKLNPACRCDSVLMGKLKPSECPLFGKICNPSRPQGACMVSAEGSCFSYYANKRTD